MHDTLEGLKQETLHLAVHIVDLFLFQKKIRIDQIYLLGLTALLIATKFEDVNQPTPDQLCRISRPQKIIFPEDVKTLESEILVTIDFDLQFSTSRRFFEIYCNKVIASETHRIFGEFILEIALIESQMLKTYKPSLLAISALYLVSMRTFNNQIKVENNCTILKSVI